MRNEWWLSVVSEDKNTPIYLCNTTLFGGPGNYPSQKIIIYCDEIFYVPYFNSCNCFLNGTVIGVIDGKYNFIRKKKDFIIKNICTKCMSNREGIEEYEGVHICESCDKRHKEGLLGFTVLNRKQKKRNKKYKMFKNW